MPVSATQRAGQGAPKSLPGLATIAQIAEWAGASGARNLPPTWEVREDIDGTVLLIPRGRCEPAFAIVPAGCEFEVLICDPDDTDELGPFASLQAALAGISWWLRLPMRRVELSATDALAIGSEPADRSPR